MLMTSVRRNPAGLIGIFLLLAVALLLPHAVARPKSQKAKLKAGGAPATAEFAGDETCGTCHGDVAGAFAVTPHGRLKTFELQGAAGRCESCHGPGSKHVEASGDATLINGFKDGGTKDASKACVSCHSDNAAMDWKGSEHAGSGVICAGCHQIHQSRRTVTPMTRMVTGSNPGLSVAKLAPPPKGSLKKSEPELCYDCHRDKRAEMNQTSHHPVREGRMTCSSCHNTHGSTGDHLLRNAESEKAFCTNCHPAKHGPFVFEHAAVEEGCTVCHKPHGSVADNLLKQNEPFLCLQCHESHFHIGREGQTAALQLPTGGSTNPNGLSGWRQAFGTKCTQCHSRIHGSDLPSQSLSSRGKALTR